MKTINSLLMLMFFIASCTTAPEKVAETEENPEPTKKDTDTPVQEELEAFGEIEVTPNAIFDVYAKTSGYLAKLSYMEGQKIKRGEMIAAIESPEFAVLHKEYRIAKSNFQLKTQQFDRSKKLYEGKSIADKEFQQVENEFQLAKANYFGLRHELIAIGFSEQQIESDQELVLKLSSPLTGNLVKINAQNGERVTPEKHLFTLIDPSKILVSMQVPAKEVDRLKTEQKFFIIHSGDSLSGSVSFVNQLIDENNTIRVHGAFDKATNLEHLTIGEKVLVRFY